MDYVGGVGARGPPSLALSPSRSLSLRLKSHCSCELFSPLIRSLSYKMKKGYRVRVRTFVCVCVCVCTAGGCTQGQRPWERPVQARSQRARLPPRQLERISASGKSRTRLRNRISLLVFLFLLFFLVSRRSLVLPTLSCRTSAPSLPLSSSCNVSRLSHFTPMPLSASSSLSH